MAEAMQVWQGADVASMLTVAGKLCKKQASNIVGWRSVEILFAEIMLSHRHNK